MLFYPPMLQNNGNVIGARSEEHFFKKLVLLHYVWMHSLCIFDHAFLAHPKPFLSSFFHPIYMDIFYLPMNFFLSLKSGSKVKSLQKLGIVKAAQNQIDFTFNNGDFPYFYQIYFFHMERSGLKSPTTLWSWISQILTFNIIFSKVCMGWSLFQMGLFWSNAIKG